MNYDIKIIGEEEDNGLIEFDRLSNLIKSTKEIATKSLMLQLRGYSNITPENSLKKALRMYLENVSGNEEDGTLLRVGCKYFSETIKGIQFEMFQSKEEILALSPMSIVIQSFNNALQPENANVELDKPLLKSLVNFRKNFISENEIFYMANRGSIPEVRITKDDFAKIAIIEESIPEPQNVIVNGQLDEMKFSKNKLGLVTQEGLVNIIAGENETIRSLVEFLGRDITIKGLAHYKSNGQLSFIEIQEFSEPGSNDKFFSRVPSALTTQQQLLFASNKNKSSNSFELLKNLSGLLKDEISDSEFEEMIKDIHR